MHVRMVASLFVAIWGLTFVSACNGPRLVTVPNGAPEWLVEPNEIISKENPRPFSHSEITGLDGKDFHYPCETNFDFDTKLRLSFLEGYKTGVQWQLHKKWPDSFSLKGRDGAWVAGFRAGNVDVMERLEAYILGAESARQGQSDARQGGRQGQTRKIENKHSPGAEELDQSR